MSDIDLYDSSGNYYGTLRNDDSGGGGPQPNEAYFKNSFFKIILLFFGCILFGVLTYNMIIHLILPSSNILFGLINSFPLIITLLIILIFNCRTFAKLVFWIKVKKMMNSYATNGIVKGKFFTKKLNNEINGFIINKIKITKENTEKIIDMDLYLDELNEIYKNNKGISVKTLRIFSIAITILIYFLSFLIIILKSFTLVNVNIQEALMALIGMVFGFGIIYIIAENIIEIVKRIKPKSIIISMIVSLSFGAIIGYILQILIFLMLELIFVSRNFDSINLGLECVIIGILGTFEICNLIILKTHRYKGIEELNINK